MKSHQQKCLMVFCLYPSNLDMLGSARQTWFVDAAAI
ncbi:hypothetical protein VIBHAR_04831 [Vibrio campbellii ATCC BAA-1116]|uniref:Uncharacterized protein n=1 Tax=Vibrio campbellii (strain ATCC BAA-1116) TaxID=2902295 RepID=A7N5Q1_VIBC1|nr:hypothetical protein VIBHAR_04831 [Vibrio campbellii ATCC BAA-1116]